MSTTLALVGGFQIVREEHSNGRPPLVLTWQGTPYKRFHTIGGAVEEAHTITEFLAFQNTEEPLTPTR